MQRRAWARNYFPSWVLKAHAWEVKRLGFGPSSSGFQRALSKTRAAETRQTLSRSACSTSTSSVLFSKVGRKDLNSDFIPLMTYTIMATEMCIYVTPLPLLPLCDPNPLILSDLFRNKWKHGYNVLSCFILTKTCPCWTKPLQAFHLRGNRSWKAEMKAVRMVQDSEQFMYKRIPKRWGVFRLEKDKWERLQTMNGSKEVTR